MRKKSGIVNLTSGIWYITSCRNSTSLPSTVATQLYRIAQEAVTNTLRHAQANRIAIRLHTRGSDVILTVEDDGCGINAEGAGSGNGLGLQTMAYRARMVGGVLSIRVSAVGGTVVECQLPHAPSGTASEGLQRSR